MKNEIILAVVQGITEFLPISSSGHLAFISKIISEPNLFFMIAMHIASLLAILIYFRRDVFQLIKIGDKKNWGYYPVILVGIIPAGFVGYFYGDLIERAISNYFLIGSGFMISTLFLLSTKLKNKKGKKISLWSGFIIGLAQILALFPGVSRSGTTTSAGILRGIDSKVAGRFSFIMFIPLMIGAMISQIDKFYFNLDLGISFLVCFFVSLGSLNLFFKSLRSGYFWIFAVWTAFMAILSFTLGVMGAF